MEKLIALLNKYEENRIEKINSEGKHFVKLGFRPYTEESLTNKAYRSCWLEICSKYYGFIKWLVDNDKIEPLGKYIGWETDEDEPYIKFDLVDQYIAYLSIQDSPIDFLCSVLK